MSNYRLGHTTITWVPYFDLDAVETAVRDIARLGFAGVETFGVVLEEYGRRRSGFERLLDDNGLVLTSAYLFSPLIDPATADDDIAANVRWAKQAKALGSDVVVVGATDRVRETYTAAEYRTMAKTVTEIGKRCLDIGVKACFHPHTGTPVETREEIDIFFDLVDRDVVFFAPDTGQIQKGGADSLEVLKTYIDSVAHVHLKDFRGGVIDVVDGREVDTTGFLNYVPLGSGAVDIARVLDTLEGAGYTGWINVELDGNEAAPRDPLVAARESKEYLDRLMATQLGAVARTDR